ncbi:hypothetical protein P4O66_019332, partial [Electrophorus voltai]
NGSMEGGMEDQRIRGVRRRDERSAASPGCSRGDCRPMLIDTWPEPQCTQCCYQRHGQHISAGVVQLAWPPVRQYVQSSGPTHHLQSMSPTSTDNRYSICSSPEHNTGSRSPGSHLQESGAEESTLCRANANVLMSTRCSAWLLEISQMARAALPNLRPVGSASSQGTDCSLGMPPMCGTKEKLSRGHINVPGRLAVLAAARNTLALLGSSAPWLPPCRGSIWTQKVEDEDVTGEKKGDTSSSKLLSLAQLSGPRAPVGLAPSAHQSV